MSAFISLKRISKRYPMPGGNVCALESIDLEIEKGEFISVVGSSGSGKSTLLYVLGTLIEPSSGIYCLDGKVITEFSDQNRSRLRCHQIGFIFQSFHLVPQLNVLQNVMLAARYSSRSDRGTLKKRASNLIERVGLGNRERHRPYELSNGEMQRVAIARALLMQPQFILADEPTGNLDEKNCNEIFQLLSEFNREGATTIMVTHDLELARRTPRQLRLQHGEVIDGGF